jgi:hypothetical protein
LIGAEAELGGKAVCAGWADGSSTEKIEEWTNEGLKLRDEVDKVVQETSAVEYGRLLRKVRLPSVSFMLLGPRLISI